MDWIDFACLWIGRGYVALGLAFALLIGVCWLLDRILNRLSLTVFFVQWVCERAERKARRRK